MQKKHIIGIAIAFMAPMWAHAQMLQISGILKRFTDFVVWPLFNGLVIIMFVYAGYKYLKGDVEDANKAVIWGVVGVAVALLSYFVIGIVKWLVLGV